MLFSTLVPSDKIIRIELTGFIPVNDVMAVVFLCYVQLLNLHKTHNTLQP